MSSPELIALTIAERKPLTGEIELFRLQAGPGRRLPGFTPGAHISVQTPSGAMRRYSLVSDPADLSHYSIAVKCEPEGRGGSASLHRQAKVDDQILVEPPDNAFELVDAPAYLFIAGGIGITPIWAMVQSLVRAGHGNWQLVYCTRSPEQTAFLAELSDSAIGGRVTIHHDSGQAESAFDFWPLLETPDDRHVYCCGPQALMDDIADMTGHWPIESIHSENFNPVQAIRADDNAFRVTISGTSQRVDVAAGQTLLEALRESGVDIRSSCESGTCGTCRLAYSGNAVIDHRDLFLMPSERQTYLMACVSRVKDGEVEVTVVG